MVAIVAKQLDKVIYGSMANDAVFEVISANGLMDHPRGFVNELYAILHIKIIDHNYVISIIW